VTNVGPTSVQIEDHDGSGPRFRWEQVDSVVVMSGDGMRPERESGFGAQPPPSPAHRRDVRAAR
jgi:hypothetical protein